MWTHSCGKPVFSSPSLLPLGGEVVLGCVDGNVYVIDSEGKKVISVMGKNDDIIHLHLTD